MKPYKRNCQLYHLSQDNLDSVMLKPRVPISRLEEEDGKHVRICFSTSIAGALRAINPAVYWHSDYYVMRPVNYDGLDIFVPSEKEVPDKSFLVS